MAGSMNVTWCRIEGLNVCVIVCVKLCVCVCKHYYEKKTMRMSNCSVSSDMVIWVRVARCHAGSTSWSNASSSSNNSGSATNTNTSTGALILLPSE